MTAEGRPLACQQVAAELPELAVGSLAGRDRARVLAHLDQCPSCAAELESLSALADELVLLAPAVEPPVGFEVALLERLGVRSPPAGVAPLSGISGAAHLSGAGVERPGSHQAGAHRRWLLAAAVVAALALAFGGGWLASSAGRPPAGHQVAAGDAHGATGGDYQEQWVSASFTSGGRTVGQLVLAPGHPAWMLVSLHGVGSTSWVSCQVITAAGTRVSVGMFPLTAGSGSWGGPVDVPVGQLRSAVLVSANGTVVARADVSPT